MIDLDDVDDSFLYGGLVLAGIVFVIYLVFSRPEIEKCEKAGGVMVKSNGDHVCIDKSALVKSETHASKAEEIPGNRVPATNEEARHE
jgi:hypothetical protein